MRMLRSLLAHPLTRGLDIDAPQTTELRRRIIQQKPFLQRLHREWYAMILSELPPESAGSVLELGTGAGWLKHLAPNLITSEIFWYSGVDLVADGHWLPFMDASLGGIAMINVFHHLANPRAFLAEAARCVRPECMIVMIEPWVTWWSCFVYRVLHHEPFDPDREEWEFASIGPLSGANGALPWIIFHRDRARFERDFPAWQIQKIELLMPFRYLFSGGVSLRSLVPLWTYGFWCRLEDVLRPYMSRWAMFARIVLVRTAASPYRGVEASESGFRHL